MFISEQVSAQRLASLSVTCQSLPFFLISSLLPSWVPFPSLSQLSLDG